MKFLRLFLTVLTASFLFSSGASAQTRSFNFCQNPLNCNPYSSSGFHGYVDYNASAPVNNQAFLNVSAREGMSSSDDLAILTGYRLNEFGELIAGQNPNFTVFSDTSDKFTFVAPAIIISPSAAYLGTIVNGQVSFTAQRVPASNQYPFGCKIYAKYYWSDANQRYATLLPYASGNLCQFLKR